MAITYEYKCNECDHLFEEGHKVADRDLPTTLPCPKCGEYEVERAMGCGGFNVPAGYAGNAKNGYNTYHGDAENYMAGRKLY